MRALITGASSGIGRAIALRLATPGSQIALCGSKASRELGNTVEAAGRNGARTAALTGALEDPETPARLIAEATALFGGLDLVVANAGISAPAPLKDLSQDDWDRVFAINVRSAWLLAKAAYPQLRASRGSIVLIASMSGVAPYGGMGAYSPSKAAQIMLAETLAQEWAADRIRVNSVSPGLFETRLTASTYADPEVRKRREGFVPLGRIGDPAADLASVVAFLASDDARYITGQNIVVDGGLLGSLQSRLPGRPASDD